MHSLTLAMKLALLQLQLLRFQRRRLPVLSALPLRPLPRIRVALVWKVWQLQALRRRRLRARTPAQQPV